MTMTRDEAQALRTARDTDARLLSRKPKHELAAIFRAETGTISLVGRYSKDELVGGILETRFPLARENEAIHVLYHDVIFWPDCPHCQQAATVAASALAEDCPQRASYVTDDPPEDDLYDAAADQAEDHAAAQAELSRIEAEEAQS